jgi:hypothetical protein
VPYDESKLRLERVNLDVSYHATYTFYGLKGAIAERWAHGPTFGAVGEIGTGQLNLTPTSGAGQDERLVGVVGLRASAMLAEGPHWTNRVEQIAPRWFHDIYEALKPQRTVQVRVETFALYPLRGGPWRATDRLKDNYYSENPLKTLVGREPFHAAVEVFESDVQPMRTIVLGVVGPPHRGTYFTFEEPVRDAEWWLGLRLAYLQNDPEGVEDPLDTLSSAMQTALADSVRLSRTAFPALVD